jgi:plastocyanin
MHLATANQVSRRSALLVATVSLGLVLAACSTNTASSTAATQSTAASQSAAAAGGTVVKLSGFKFDPATLTIKVGTKVTFQNMDGVDHTVTNGKDGTPEASALFDMSAPAGASVDFTFTTAGTFNVTCKIHHAMNMTITVQ